MTRLHKLILGAAGLTALGIGLGITFMPQDFQASYGIVANTNPAALSELRAPGANLAMLGAVILAGAVRTGMAGLSAALGTLVFFAFAGGRLVSLALDGWPGEAIASALVIELVFGGLCLWTWRGLGVSRQGQVAVHAR